MNHNLHTIIPLVIYTTNSCGLCHSLRFFFNEYGVRYINIDIETSPLAAAYVLQINEGYLRVPVVVFPDDTIFIEPTIVALSQKLGLIVERP